MMNFNRVMNRTRTEAFDSIKTRRFIYQNPDGSFPPAGSIFSVADNNGTLGLVADISVNNIDITNATITNVESVDISATYLTIQDISAVYLTIQNITTSTLSVQDISAVYLTIQDITTNNLTVEDISAIYLTIQDITTNNLTVEDISAIQINVQEITTNQITVQDISADYLTIQNISATQIVVNDISGSSASFLDLQVDALSANDMYINGSLGIGKIAQNELDVSGSAGFLGNVSIGKVHGVHELDVDGHVYVQSDGSATKTFTQPGVHTIRIPQFVSTLQVQLIGSGGYSANGGGGGYIRGTVDVSGFGGQKLTIQVGSLGSGLCSQSSSSYLTFLPAGPLLTVAGAGGNGFNGTALGVVAAGGNGGGGSFDGSGVANGSAGAISSINATSGGGGSSVGGSAAASPPGTIVYQIPQPGQGRPAPENYIEASGGTGGFNESCGPAGGSGYAGGGQGLFAATTGGTFLAGGGGGGSSYVGPRVSNITSYAGGAVPLGIMSSYGRGNQNGCVIISYTDIPSIQTNGDIVCGGNLRVDGQITGPLDVSGAMSVDILNVRKFINDTSYTSSISTDIVRTLGILVGSEDPNITPAAAIHVLSGLVKVEGDISCNTLSYGTLNPDVVHSVSTPAGSGVSIGGTAANPTISVFIRGMIMMFSGPSAPDGWAFCNGANGTPDLRDRFIVGAGSTYAQGATGGEATVTLTTNQIPIHKHTITDPGHTHSTKGYWNVGSASGDSKQAASVNSVDYGIGTNFNTIFGASTGITETNNEGGGVAHENRPPYYALAFIMKL